MASLQAGQRALSLSANVIMATTTTCIKDTGCIGILRLLLLGILLPSVLVSGQSTTSSNPSTSSTDALTSSSGASTDTATNQSPLITGGPASTTNTQSPATTSGGPASTTTSGGQASTTDTQSPTTATTSGVSAATTQSVTSTSTTASSTPVNANSISTTNSGSTASSTAGSTAMTPSSGSMTASSSSSSTSMMMYNNQSSNTTGVTPGMNGTATSNFTSMSMIYCPSFMCNYSDCYTMYTSQNATSCTNGTYCQLVRQTDICYTASCSASCADSCANASQTNCSVDCCNSTGCLNSSFASMMMTTTTVAAKTTTTTTTAAAAPATTTKTTSASTVAATTPQTNNGMKCHTGSCTGATCYTTFKAASLQTCTSSQPHCQLKKETVKSDLQWTAGCTTNCSGQTPCKTSTKPPCHLECCNATLTSCLWLNGTLNVPSFATRCHFNTELIASLICLLAIALLL